MRSTCWQNDGLLKSERAGILQHLGFTNNKSTLLTFIQISHSNGTYPLTVNFIFPVTFQSQMPYAMFKQAKPATK